MTTPTIRSDLGNSTVRRRIWRVKPKEKHRTEEGKISMKRLLSMLLSILFVLSMLAVAAPAAVAVSSDGLGVDIVLIIDRSGTMNRNDPKNLALQAAKMFVDRSSTTGDSMAIIWYGYGVSPATRFYDMSSELDREDIKNALDHEDITNVKRNEDTNTGAALKAAYDLISARRSDPMYASHKFAIVLFSDGYTDIGDSDGFKSDFEAGKFGAGVDQTIASDQATEDSRKKAKEISDNCKSEGISLGAIRLNTLNNQVDTDMKNWVTQYPELYETAVKADELPGIIGDFYQRITNNDNAQDITNGEFVIPENTLEANIQIVGSKLDLTKVKITDSFGTDLDLNDRSIVHAYQDKKYGYISVKLLHPVMGTYSIALPKDAKYSVTLSLIRDLFLELDVDDTNPHERSTITATIKVTKQGQIFSAPAGTILYVKIRCPDGTEQIVSATEDTSKPGTYYAALRLDTIGEYVIQADLKNKVENVSNKVRINATKKGMDAVGTLPDVEYSFYQQKDNPQQYIDDMTMYFYSPDGKLGCDDFMIEIEDINVVQEIRTNDKLELNLNGSGQTEITIWAISNFTESNGTVVRLTSDPQKAVIKVNAGQQVVLSEEGKKMLWKDTAERGKRAIWYFEIPGQLPRMLVQDTSVYFEDPTDTAAKIVSVSANAARTDALDADTGMTIEADEKDRFAVFVTKVLDPFANPLATYTIEMSAEGEGGGPSSDNYYLNVKVITFAWLLIFFSVFLLAVVITYLIIKYLMWLSSPSWGNVKIQITMPADPNGMYAESRNIVPMIGFGRRIVKLTELVNRAGLLNSVTAFTDRVQLAPLKNGARLLFKSKKGKRTSTIREDEEKLLHISDTKGDITLEYSRMQ